MKHDYAVSKYDRLRGGLQGVALFTRSSTIKNVQTVTGKLETFVIETARREEMGDYIFVECMDETGLVRLALPPRVANVIAAQCDSLTRPRGEVSRARCRPRAGKIEASCQASCGREREPDCWG